MDNVDTLKRVYVQLRSLQENLHPTHPNSPMEWDEVNLYNSLLTKLEQAGYNIEDFKLPPASDEVVESNYLTHETVATGSSNIRYGIFKIKLDAILSYFEVSGETTHIGFRADQE